MKNRKQIVKDIDEIWNNHLIRFKKVDGKYKISFSSRIASYILKNFNQNERT